MSTLTEKDIIRIAQRVKGNGTGSGSAVSGGVSQEWVRQNFVTIDFFTSLFTAHDADGGDIDVNDVDTEVANIEAMTGLWTEKFLSALGENDDTGSGGSDTLANLLDVTLGSTLRTGDVLTWNGSKWTNQASQSSGGTVTSVAMTVPTGFEVTGSPITGSGILALSFANGYGLPTTEQMTAWTDGLNVEDWAIKNNSTKIPFSKLPTTMFWANVNVSETANTQTDPTFGNVTCNQIKIGSAILSFDTSTRTLQITYARSGITVNLSATGGITGLATTS